MTYQSFTENQELAKAQQIIPEEELIPESLYKNISWYWEFQTKRKLTDFLVCKYANFQQVVNNLGYSPEHLKVTVKTVEYAVFEMPRSKKHLRGSL